MNPAVSDETMTADERFVEYIGGLDAAAKAALRRSLAFSPGTWPGVFAYVEPWVVNARAWERKITYLTAGLQVLSRSERNSGDIGAAAARLQKATESGSVEQRFLALLDSDADELPHRLRQMVTLMSSADIAPSWSTLRKDLRWWNTEARTVQQRWAASYYRDTSSDKTQDGSVRQAGE